MRPLCRSTSSPPISTRWTGLTARRRLLRPGNFANPDIAEPHRLGVVLYAQRLLSGMGRVNAVLSPDGRADKLVVILHQDAVENHRHHSRFEELIAVEA